MDEQKETVNTVLFPVRFLWYEYSEVQNRFRHGELLLSTENAPVHGWLASKVNKFLHHSYSVHTRTAWLVAVAAVINWAPPHENAWESESIVLRILNPLTRWRVPRPGCFIPEERSRGDHWIEGLVDAVTKKESYCYCQESNRSHLTRCLVTILAEIPRLLWRVLPV
jgi:hypothetical protein